VVELNDPTLFELNDTDPVGVIGVPKLVSDTPATQVTGAFTGKGLGEHVSTVEVDRFVTVRP
jgi:hypothetical protein